MLCNDEMKNMPTASTNPIRVFLIDDSSIVRTMLTQALSLDHSLHIIGTASDGLDALAQLQSLPPNAQADVIVTDMDMPRMNGLEFIRQMKSSSNELCRIPIILLSSWTQSDKRITSEAMEAGAADFIPKPSAMDSNGFHVTLHRLVAKLKAVVAVKAATTLAPTTLAPTTLAPTTLPATTFAPIKSPNNPLAQNSSPQNTLTQRSPHLVVGIGEMAVSATHGTLIKVFALGSCVAVNLFSPNAGIVGMAHIALPSSSIAPEKALLLPGYYADTAIPALLKAFRAAGYAQADAHLTAKIAGGAITAADTQRHFNIGERNYHAVQAALRAHSITIAGEDIGGQTSRTAWIQAGSHTLSLAVDNARIRTL